MTLNTKPKQSKDEVRPERSSIVRGQFWVMAAFFASLVCNTVPSTQRCAGNHGTSGMQKASIATSTLSAVD
jgi:hypothetical protein